MITIGLDIGGTELKAARINNTSFEIATKIVTPSKELDPKNSHSHKQFIS